eukprot:TRINITY_DN202_c0_g1_i1.p1 TRINITY_DN202_c0_g1~~TRINITY_DN202_c0_g1_i1.p1  ORF type:complete len:156 (+),score=44.22 TRINITY_DN202_c0_g1_i1:243-710(+)
MCQLSVQDNALLTVNDWEAKQPGYITTVQVLRYFSELYNKDAADPINVRLLCGADLIESIIKPDVWDVEDVHEILGKFGLVVIERAGSDAMKCIMDSDILSQYARNIFVVREFVTNDISSTKIRLLARRKMSMKYFISDALIKYIEDNKLYQEPA